MRHAGKVSLFYLTTTRLTFETGKPTHLTHTYYTLCRAHSLRLYTCRRRRWPDPHYSIVHMEVFWLGTLPDASSLFHVAHAARASERRMLP